MTEDGTDARAEQRQDGVERRLHTELRNAFFWRKPREEMVTLGLETFLGVCAIFLALPQKFGL